MDMSEKKSFDADAVRQLAQVLDETDLTEIEYENDQHRIRVVRKRAESTFVAPHLAPATIHSSPAPSAATETSVEKPTQDPSSHPGAVKSPMVGNAYRSPEPNASPFVNEGDEVKEGQTILIIEAMKVMNPIKAPRSGKVSKIFVSDTAPVEFDEVLMIIE